MGKCFLLQFRRKVYLVPFYKTFTLGRKFRSLCNRSSTKKHVLTETCCRLTVRTEQDHVELSTSFVQHGVIEFQKAV